MCYTGKCKYEDHMGNCQLSREECVTNYPDDAHCAQIEKGIYEVETVLNLIMLPVVTEPLTLNAATYLAKNSPLGYPGVSEGMLIDVEIVLEYARETYQRWLNEHVGDMDPEEMASLLERLADSARVLASRSTIAERGLADLWRADAKSGLSLAAHIRSFT